MLEEYEINDQTLAILPVDKDTSQVLETKRRFYVSKTPRMIISDSCEYYGSTLDGRMHGAKVLTGIQYKTPIVVEESSPMIFFPTESPRKDLCTWINLKHVKDYYESGKKDPFAENSEDVEVEETTTTTSTNKNNTESNNTYIANEETESSNINENKVTNETSKNGSTTGTFFENKSSK